MDVKIFYTPNFTWMLRLSVDRYIYLLVKHGFLLFQSCSFRDPGPHGNGRYSEHMLPEIERKDFRKGAQVLFSPC